MTRHPSDAMALWATREGWSLDTQLALALEYITRFCNHQHFEKFLTETARVSRNTVHVLTIDTDDGPVVWVGRTEEVIWKYLEEYVRENWPGDRPFPNDLDEAIEQYFVESVETYSIEQVTVGE